MDNSGTVSLDRPDGDVAVVALRGEHDLGTAADVRACLAEAREAARVIVDLTPAAFVDSSILGAILDARRISQEVDQPFAVALEGDGAGSVRRVLEITGLIEELPVHPSVAAAIDSVGPAAS